MRCKPLVLIAALAAWAGHALAADILYQTGFEPPEFTVGPTLREQDGWIGGWFAPGTSHPTAISTVNSSDGVQCVRFDGADAQGSIVGNAYAVRPLFDLNDPNPPATPQIVEIRADVRLDGPQTGTLGTPQQDLISANLFAVVQQHDRNPYGNFDIGGFFVSSAGKIWAYSWVTGNGRAIYGNSIRYVMGTYHSLTLRVNFLTRTLTYFVDGAELGSSPIPVGVKSEQLIGGYLSMYGGTQVIDTPELSYNRANYNGYFDNYSVASIPLTPADAVVQFAATDYAVKESDSSTTVDIIRRGYTNSAVSVTLSSANGTASADRDYKPISTIVSFAPGETAKSVKLKIKNDDLAERDETILLTLSAPSPEIPLPRATAPLWILDDERAGSVDPKFGFDAGPLGLTQVYEAPSIVPTAGGRFLATVFGEDASGNYTGMLARFNQDGSVDSRFEPYPLPYGTGPSQVTPILGGVRILVNTGDGLARLQTNGREDANFTVSTLFGTDPGFITDVLVQPDQRIIIVGLFDSVNGVARNNIARLRLNGEVDTSFDAGDATDDYIADAALQPDGRILIVGAFQNVAGEPRPLLARLNRNGSVDPSLNTGTGFGDSNNGFPGLNTIALQRDGRILVGGYFDSYQGAPVVSLARLLPDGTLDAGFTTGNGFESSFIRGTPGYVNGVTLQPDGEILVTGGFGYVDGVWAHGVVRLHRNGSLDTTFQMGGTDSFAAAINGGPGLAILPGGDILTFLYSNVSFLKDEPVRYQGIVRLNGDPKKDDRGSDK